MKKVILNGQEMDMDVVLHYMDSEILDDLHRQRWFDNDQQLVDAYIKAHAAKYDGEKFVIN